jgi:hypothetical protein
MSQSYQSLHAHHLARQKHSPLLPQHRPPRGNNDRNQAFISFCPKNAQTGPLHRRLRHKSFLLNQISRFYPTLLLIVKSFVHLFSKKSLTASSLSGLLSIENTHGLQSDSREKSPVILATKKTTEQIAKPMKKLVLTSLSLVVGAALVQAQGTISLQETQAGTVQTNGATAGLGTGNVGKAASGYYYDVLDMTQTSWAGLSSGQQTGAGNLLANPSDISLWTDSGVTGINGTLTAGGITGLGAASGTSAANWAEPSSQLGGYSSAGSYDYYVVVGWSANLGTTWASASSVLSGNSSAGAGLQWFGESAVLYNYAGGNGNNSPNVFSPSSFTGLSGSGSGAAQVNPELVLMPVPEPATLALAGLGGLSMLFLRRRKS